MAPFVSFQGHSFSFLNPRFLLPQHAWWPRESPHTSLSPELVALAEPGIPPSAQPPAASTSTLSHRPLPSGQDLTSVHVQIPTHDFTLCPLPSGPLGHTALQYLQPHIEYSEGLSTPHVSLYNVVFSYVISSCGVLFHFPKYHHCVSFLRLRFQITTNLVA